jgi:hypothetical protein
MGMTFVHLHQADGSLIAGALNTAFHNLQRKQSEKRKQPEKKSSRTAKAAKPSR